MKVKSLFTSAIALLIAFGVLGNNAYANEEIENACMDKADEQNISDDKYDDFVQKCIDEAKAKSVK